MASYIPNSMFSDSLGDDIAKLRDKLNRERAALLDMEREYPTKTMVLKKELNELVIQLQDLSGSVQKQLQQSPPDNIEEGQLDKYVGWLSIKTYISTFLAFQDSLEKLCSLRENEVKLATAETSFTSDHEVSQKTKSSSVKSLQGLGEMAEHLARIKSMLSSLSRRPGVFAKLKAFMEVEVGKAQTGFNSILAGYVSTLASGLGWPLAISNPKSSSLDSRHKTVPVKKAPNPTLDPLDLLKDLIFLVMDRTDCPQFHIIELLLNSIIIRIKYHFDGKRETNRADKPEWYLSFIQKCLNSTVPFVRDHLDPIYNRKAALDGSDHGTASSYLVKRIIELVRDKMSRTLEFVSKQSHLYSHAVNEILQFDRFLWNKFGYRGPLFESSRILFKGTVFFQTWYDAEKNFAFEKATEMISEPDCWDGGLLTSVQHLLLAITERFKLLPDLDGRLEFVQGIQKPLLVDLVLPKAIINYKSEDESGAASLALDDDPAAIVQKIRIVCNQCNFCLGIMDLLREWEDEVLFAELYEHLSLSQNMPESHSLFGPVISAFENSLQMLLSTRLFDLCSERYNINAKSYSREMAPVLDPSPALCRLLVQLEPIINALQKNLSPLLLGGAEAGLGVLYGGFERKLYDRLDEILFEELKRHARVWDLEDALLWANDLKHIWGSKAEGKFPRCKEMTLVLTLPNSESEVVTVNTLTKALATQKDDQVFCSRYLSDTLGIKVLKSNEILEILSKRRDAKK